MPMFEYLCKECGHTTSFLEKPGSSKEHVCEKCGSADMKKVFSSFAAKSGGSASGSSSCPTGSCPLG